MAKKQTSSREQRQAVAMKPTSLGIRNLMPDTKPYKISLGAGLQLWVLPGGSKVWRFRWRRPDEAGKLTREQSITLGHFPDLSLEAAQKAALEHRASCRQGIDPADERRKQRDAAAAGVYNTLERAADGWWEEHFKSKGKENTLHAQQVRRDLAGDIMPFLGKKPVAAVDAEMIRGCLARVADRGAKSRANRLLVVLHAIFQWAIGKKLTTENPTIALKAAFPGLRKDERKNFPAATNPARLGRILLAVDEYPDLMTRSALLLCSLTLARPGEIVSMRWADVDMTAGTWLRKVSKVFTELVTPLSRQALAVLERARVQSGHTEWCFPGRYGDGHMMTSTLTYALKRLGIADHVAHGFRAAGRTILDEKLGFRPDIIEQQLGHNVRNPNGTSYARMQFLEQRAEMLQRWADFLAECREGVK